MIPNVGPLEIFVVLVVALLVFGPKKLPELGGSVGRGIREFGRGIKGEREEPELVEGAATPAPEARAPQAEPAAGRTASS
jgi:sec-independent protein translocase protein TatA